MAVTASRGDDLVDTVLTRFVHGRSVSESSVIEDLGLSSLERVELMMALEHELETCIDESALSSARTLRDLRILASTASRVSDDRGASVVFPSWNRSWPARLVRWVVQAGCVGPVTRLVTTLTIEGREHLDRLSGPVVFAANHQSHMDTPVILAALPPSWRRRLAPAVAMEYFAAHFFPAGQSWRERWISGVVCHLAALCFGAFPLPQRAPGARDTMRNMGSGQV